MYGLSTLLFLLSFLLFVSVNNDLAAAIPEQDVLGSPKARHRHSSSMSNPLEHEVVLEGKRKQVLDDVLAVSTWPRHNSLGTIATTR